MGNLLTRAPRIDNNCSETVTLKIGKSPGDRVIKEICIPKDGFVYVPYSSADDTYNPDSVIFIDILNSRKIKCGSIDKHQIRDNQSFELVMDGNGRAKVNKEVEGNLFGRLGISWMVKEKARMVKKHFGTKPEQKKGKESTKKGPEEV